MYKRDRNGPHAQCGLHDGDRWWVTGGPRSLERRKPKGYQDHERRGRLLKDMLIGKRGKTIAKRSAVTVFSKAQGGYIS